MPESKTNVLIWDGSQKNFTTFEDKVFESFLDGNGGRTTQQWYMNSDASITEHNLEEFGKTLWNISPGTPPLEPVGCAVVMVLEPKPAWSRLRRPEELPPSTVAAGAAVPAIIGWAPAPPMFFFNGVSRILSIANFLWPMRLTKVIQLAHSGHSVAHLCPVRVPVGLPLARARVATDRLFPVTVRCMCSGPPLVCEVSASAW
jgi:hypothetical protein